MPGTKWWMWRPPGRGRGTARTSRAGGSRASLVRTSPKVTMNDTSSVEQRRPRGASRLAVAAPVRPRRVCAPPPRPPARLARASGRPRRQTRADLRAPRRPRRRRPRPARRATLGACAAGARGSSAPRAPAASRASINATARAGPRRAPRARLAPGRPSRPRAAGTSSRDDRAGGDERLLADLDARASAPRRRRRGRRGAASAPRSGVAGAWRAIVSSLVVIAHGPTKTSSSTTLKAVR